jgi:hypothetical protein
MSDRLTAFRLNSVNSLIQLGKHWGDPLGFGCGWVSVHQLDSEFSRSFRLTGRAQFLKVKEKGRRCAHLRERLGPGLWWVARTGTEEYRKQNGPSER